MRRRRLVIAGAACGLVGVFALSWAAPADPSTTSAPVGPGSAIGADAPISMLGRWVSVPAGTFTMGAPTEEPGWRADESPVSVTLTRGLLFMSAEVTQRQWRAIMGNNPSEDARCRAYDGVSLVGDDLPVTCVSWMDAIAFVNQASARAGLTPAYHVDGERVSWDSSANGLRLPTEAEWEYAARAGEGSRFVGAAEERLVCEVGNVADLTGKAKWSYWEGFACADGFAGLAPVRSFRANTWGLHDMVGNVAEWTWDGYVDRLPGGLDPHGPPDGELRVVRGGAWTNVPSDARVAARASYLRDERRDRIGLRVVRWAP